MDRYFVEINRLFNHVLQLKVRSTKLPDQISELTEDALAYILSKLSPKEAARMCSLSRKWQRLYWKVTTNLVFDEGFEIEEESRQINFVKHISESLESNEAGILEKLRIRCGLDNFLNKEIDKWVKFAFSKRVERFDLDLLVWGYMLTRELFSRIESISCFTSLHELRLKGVDINEEIVYFLLHHCTNLKQLAIVDSPSLVRFSVRGRICKLRSLELAGWFEYVEIANVSFLDTLALYGNVDSNMIDMRIDSIPSLVDLSIGGGISFPFFQGSMYYLLEQLSSSLKSLTIKLTSHDGIVRADFMPEMTSLEKFVLQITAENGSTEYWVDLMTRFFRPVKEFVLQAAWKKSTSMSMDAGNRDTWHGVHLPTIAKEVTLAGYYGCFDDVNVASFFLNRVVGLERMIIDPHNQKNLLLGLPPNRNHEEGKVRAARRRAHKQLDGRVPPGLQFVIL